MSKWIDADELKKKLEEYDWMPVRHVEQIIDGMQRVELTEDDVIRYCTPRCLVIMTYEYFHWLIRGQKNDRKID